MATALFDFASTGFFHKERLVSFSSPVGVQCSPERNTDLRHSDEMQSQPSKVETSEVEKSPEALPLTVGVPEPRQYEIVSEHTYFIIDWDDTLLATSWLARRQINLDTVFIPPKESAELEALDTAACSFLRKIIYLYGKVLIVTNAQQGWVELSAKKFLPETYDLIFSPSSASCYSFSSSSSCFNNDGAEPEQTASFSVDYLQRTNNLSGKEGSTGNVTSVKLRNGKKKARISTPMDIDCHDSFSQGTHQNDACKDVDSSERISVFSARYLFEKDFPSDPSAWKRKAFQKLLKSRISSNFFIFRPATPTKSQSADMLLELDETRSQSSRASRLERRNSSLSGIDLSDLVELEGESFEVETEFHENDSFFSFDFRPSLPSELGEFDFDDSHHLPHNEEGSIDPDEVPARVAKCTACNIISIGDCFHDCDSLRNVELELKDTFKKTVKLIEFPEISQVIKQVEELEMHLDKIVKAKRDIDLVVDRSYL